MCLANLLKNPLELKDNSDLVLLYPGFRFFKFLIHAETCKTHRKRNITPKMVKPILLDLLCLDLSRKNVKSSQKSFVHLQKFLRLKLGFSLFCMISLAKHYGKITEIPAYCV